MEVLEPRTVLAAGPVVSEFLASNNSGLSDEDGDSSDWIEIFNGTSDRIDLSGWHLTDSADELDRWEFPQIALDAGGYLVVFASGKDRRDPATELHTNFSLDADREFLALVEPDGTTIAHQYAPEFPEQRSDISYGISQGAETVVDVGAEWRYFVPTSGSLGSSWQQVEFDDTAWQTGPSGFGYGIRQPGFDVRAVYASGQIPILRSLRQADELIGLPESDSLVDRVATAVTPDVNFFDTGGDAHYGNNMSFPGGSPADDNHFVVQAVGRVTVPQSGTYTFGINSDDGARLRIDGADVIVDNAVHGPRDTFGQVFLSSGSHELELIYFENTGGAELELFAAPGSHTSYNSLFRLVGDVARGGLPISTVMSTASISTDFQGDLAGVNTSAYFRREVLIDDPQSVEAMSLRLRFDDAFVAYLNGVEVARRGVSGAISWNAAADAARPVEESVTVETVPLGQFTSLLQEGANVLAIQAMTAGADDTSFLLEPQLFLTRTGGTSVYFTEPTPGAPNGQGIAGIVQEPTASVQHGFFTAPFTVALQTPTEGATIRYTTDGSDPVDGNGIPYRGPITIDRTTTLRAAAGLDGHLDSRIATQTYVFLEDVIRQSPRPPAGWPSGSVNGQRLNYGMDPQIVGGVYTEDEVIESLSSIPSISMVTELDNLFDSRTGIYVNAGNRGSDWERPVSVELIHPDGSEGFQVDAGMRIRGGFSRQGNNPKHAFRLFFRSRYGDAALEYPLFGDEGVDTFKNIDLRTAQNYSWAFQSSGEASFTREVFSRDTQRDMGRPYTRSRYYHLYINGQYWGLFQTQERAEADYAASYFGGSPEDYDVVKSTGNFGGYTIEATDGRMDAWSQLWDLAVQYAQNPTARSNHYWTMQGLRPDGTRDESLPVLLDVDALIDYMIIVFYTGNTDAPLSNFLGNDRPNNWFGIYNRETADRGFMFFQHDAEHSLGTSGSSGDRTGPYNSGNRFNLSYSNPQFLHQHLMAHPEYRMRWADRTQLHLFNEGALTAEKNLERFNDRVGQVDGAIIAESARWGDAARSVPFTRTEWLAQINEVRNYFQNRKAILLSQLRRDGLYPRIDAPEFLPHGGTVPANASLLISNPSDAGTVYYTLDGSDPRLLGGGVSPEALVYNDAASATSLVPKGSTWRYLDDGSNQGTAWRESEFDDSSWRSGPAQLGYGDQDEATVVGFGDDATNKHITTYFRRTFDVSDAQAVADLALSILVDDGAVVYINGQEVKRVNMAGAPGSPVAFDQRASTDVGGSAESTFFLTFPISPGALVDGQNTVAVEVHQFTPSSSDISFDLELQATVLSGGIELAESATVSARVLEGADWSALVQADFLVAEVPADASNLRISEINYNPYAALPQFGDEDVDNDEFEFIELVNINQAETVSLSGVTFTDGIEFDFTDSEITQLGPLERVLVVRNADAFASRYGTGLPVAGQFTRGALANEGEAIELRDRDGGVIQSFSYNDGGEWPERADGDGSTLVVVNVNGSYDAADNWRASTAFGGAPGLGDARVIDVIINEVLANPDPSQDDAIELFNTQDTEVTIGGWWLSDSADNLFKYRIPDGTLLPAGGYRVFTADQFGAGNDGFGISADGEEVWLVAADASGKPLRFADNVAFDATLEGVSLGRVPSGNPDGRVFPLAATSLGGANGGHRPGAIIVSEVHYHPAAPPPGTGIAEDQLEFLELYNRSESAIDLAGWRVRGGVDFDFATGTELTPGESLILVNFDPADPLLTPVFRDIHEVGAGAVLLGPYAGKLDNGGEEVRLLAPVDPSAGPMDLAFYLVDRVAYNDEAPWPTQPDGSGASLARRSADNYGDAAESWSPAAPSPGSAEFDAVALAGDFNGNGRVEQGDLDLVLLNWGQPGSPAPDAWINDPPRGTIDQQELEGVLLNWGASLAAAHLAAADSAPLAGTEEYLAAESASAIAAAADLQTADAQEVLSRARDESFVPAGRGRQQPADALPPEDRETLADGPPPHARPAQARGPALSDDDQSPRRDAHQRQERAKDLLFGRLDVAFGPQSLAASVTRRAT